MDFALATHEEILRELGGRLRAQRLVQGLRQVDLASMAGVSVGTLKALESSGTSSLQAWVRVLAALGLQQDLQPLFVLQKQSIAQMALAHQMARKPRQRAPRKSAQ